MANADTVKAKINGLIAKVNDITHSADADLSSAINRLVDETHFSNEGRIYFENLVFPDSVTTIGEYAYEDCALIKRVEFGNNIQTLRAGAFYGCESIESIIIPDSVINMYNSVFAGCSSLIDVKISQNLTQLYSNVFNRTGLISVIIPKKIKRLGSGVFYGCVNMEYMTILSDTVATMEDLSVINYNYCNIYVPSSLLGNYKQATNWSRYADRIFAIESNADVLQEASENGYTG